MTITAQQVEAWNAEITRYHELLRERDAEIARLRTEIERLNDECRKWVDSAGITPADVRRARDALEQSAPEPSTGYMTPEEIAADKSVIGEQDTMAPLESGRPMRPR